MTSVRDFFHALADAFPGSQELPSGVDEALIVRDVDEGVDVTVRPIDDSYTFEEVDPDGQAA